MTKDLDLDTRLQRSVRILRGWRWMAKISTRPQEALVLLTTEAKALIALGVRYPARARTIGKLIIAYEHVITELKGKAGPDTPARNTPDEEAA